MNKKHMENKFLRIILLTVLFFVFTIINVFSGDNKPTRVIANWDIVPYQIISGSFKAGVVAFHESGVNVTFYINGLEIKTVTAPSYNNRTGVWEYWIELNSRDYKAGPIILTAIAAPDENKGLAKELPEIILYADSAGSLKNNTVKYADCNSGNDTSGDGSLKNPYKTIEKAYIETGSGGTVYLLTGKNYELTGLYANKNFKYWTTVTTAPGVSREQVEIKGGRFYENMVHWKNVSIYTDIKGYSNVLYLDPGYYIWLEDVELYDKNGHHNGADTFNVQGDARLFITGTPGIKNSCIIRNITNAASKTFLARNVYMDTIGNDGFFAKSNQVIINIWANNFDPGTEMHSDFLQFHSPDGTPADNVIVYNVIGTKMNCQGIFGVYGSNVALVNILIQKVPPGTPKMSQLREMDHLLLWHVTYLDLTLYLRVSESINNIDIKNCILYTLITPNEQGLINPDISNNHFYSPIKERNSVTGENFTWGEPGFISENNFSLKTSSPAKLAGSPLECVPADINGQLYNSDNPSCGAFAF